MAFSFFKKKNKDDDQQVESGPQIVIPPASLPNAKNAAEGASATSDLSKPSLGMPVPKVPPAPATASLSKPTLRAAALPPPPPGAPASLQPPPSLENKILTPPSIGSVPPSSATKKLPLPKINLGAPMSAPPSAPRQQIPQVAPGDLSGARLPMPSLSDPKTLGSSVPLIKKPNQTMSLPGMLGAKTSAPVPSGPPPAIIPSVQSVEIPLSVIAKAIPEDMVNPSEINSSGHFVYDAKKMIEQLSLGKVTLSLGEIAQVAPHLLLDPTQHHDQIINLPLGEIVKIAPKGLLQKRADQIEEKMEGVNIPTPFSEIAKKDALKAATPAPAVTPPAPSQLSATPPAAPQPPSAAPVPTLGQKVEPKPFAPPIPRTAPISHSTPSTGPIVKTGPQPLPAIPISTIMLNRPGSSKPTIPIAPATTPISKSILTPSQRGVQAPNLLNRISPSSLGAQLSAPAKSLLPSPPKKTEFPEVTKTITPPVNPQVSVPVLTQPAPQAQPPVQETTQEPTVSEPKQEQAPATPTALELTPGLLNLMKKAGITETGTIGVHQLIKSISGIDSCLISSVSGNILLETDPLPSNQAVAQNFAATYVNKVLRHAEPLHLAPIKKITIRTGGNKNISIFRAQNIVMIAEHHTNHLCRKSSTLLNDIVGELVNSVS